MPVIENLCQIKTPGDKLHTYLSVISSLRIVKGITLLMMEFFIKCLHAWYNATFFESTLNRDIMSL